MQGVCLRLERLRDDLRARLMENGVPVQMGETVETMLCELHRVIVHLGSGQQHPTRRGGDYSLGSRSLRASEPPAPAPGLACIDVTSTIGMQMGPPRCGTMQYPDSSPRDAESL